ncbi:hypothetical protein Tco_1048812, partial [Tanacetum coccineum]
VTMALLPSGFLKPLYPDIMDMINDQNIKHTISPTPPSDHPLMSYLSGRGMKPLESEPVPEKSNELDASPSMTQAAIRKLVADSVAVALEAQAATMAKTDNANRNTRQSGIPVRKVLLASSAGLNRTESIFLRSNCTEDCKVKFATSTLTEEALSWWNSFAQPIRIEEAYKITWFEFKQLLIKKYCPRTEIKKME